MSKCFREKQNRSQNNKTTKDKFKNNRVTVLVWKQNGEGGYVRTLNLLKQQALSYTMEMIQVFYKLVCNSESL
jgi:hypothetical protein